MGLSDQERWQHSAPVPAVTQPSRRPFATATLRSERGRQARAAYLFLIPTFLGFVLFTAGPLLASIWLSLTTYDAISPPSYVGLTNYRDLLDDTRALGTFRTTAVFVVASVAIELVVALFLAVGVQRRMPSLLRYFFRTTFLLPVVTSAAAMSIIFGYLFNKEFGVINFYLGEFGINRVSWLTSSRMSLVTIILAASWQRIGFTFILFVAGLQNIPRDLYEAADLDGASEWSKLLSITVPLLTPTILFNAVIGVISSLQVFDIPYIMTRGGPGDSSRTVVMMIQEAAFQNLQFGYGSAIAVVLFVVIMLLTILQFWLSQRWVFYR